MESENMTPIHMFKCPGPYKASYGIIYDLRGANSKEEKDILETNGWSLTLQESAEKAGTKAFLVVKQKNVKKRKPYKAGHPYVAPKPEPIIEVKKDVRKEEETETKLYETETKTEKEEITLEVKNLSKINELIEKLNIKEAAKVLNVSWQKLSSFKKKNNEY